MHDEDLAVATQNCGEIPTGGDGDAVGRAGDRG
jgi:hypothetical protein